MKTVQVKAPGKLYIAGEYAVVEPGHSAIITAINRFVTLRVSQSVNEYGSIYSEGFTKEPIKWMRVNDQVELEQASDNLKYVLSAIHTTETYLAEQYITLVEYDMHIESELDNQTGHKLGLGSSGAVTVATVRGLLEFYGLKPSDLTVYKLSVLSQLNLGINSSFGDIAAITYTGWIQYTSFDRQFVHQYQSRHNVSETVDAYWTKLMIKKLKVPRRLQFLVGWTGSPASSDDLVGAVQDKKQQTTEQYESFLNESNLSVQLLVSALETNNKQKIKRAIKKNRQALVQMGEESNVVIETPVLKQLCDIAIRHGGAAKTSGAGGGDSGIAFMFGKNKTEQVLKEWDQIGVSNLPVRIYKK